MQKYKAELLAAAWRELDQIADIHMTLAGSKSAENITDKILNAIELLEEHPFKGTFLLLLVMDIREELWYCVVI